MHGAVSIGTLSGKISFIYTCPSSGRSFPLQPLVAGEPIGTFRHSYGCTIDDLQYMPKEEDSNIVIMIRDGKFFICNSYSDCYHYIKRGYGLETHQNNFEELGKFFTKYKYSGNYGPDKYEC